MPPQQTEPAAQEGGGRKISTELAEAGQQIHFFLCIGTQRILNTCRVFWDFVYSFYFSSSWKNQICIVNTLR